VLLKELARRRVPRDVRQGDLDAVFGQETPGLAARRSGGFAVEL
jgi:hypothetical protein